MDDIFNRWGTFWYILDGGTFHVNLMCLFIYAYCFASKKLSMQIMAAY